MAQRWRSWGAGGCSGERPTGAGGGREEGGAERGQTCLARPASASCLPASVGGGGPFIMGGLRQQEEDGTFTPCLISYLAPQFAWEIIFLLLSYFPGTAIMRDHKGRFLLLRKSY